MRKFEFNVHAIPLTAETVVVDLELAHGPGPGPKKETPPKQFL